MGRQSSETPRVTFSARAITKEMLNDAGKAGRVTAELRALTGEHASVHGSKRRVTAEMRRVTGEWLAVGAPTEPVSGAPRDGGVWLRQKTHLSYRAGVVQLGNAPFFAAVRKTHVSNLCEADTERAPVDQMRAHGTDIALIPSCPIADDARRVVLRDGYVRYVRARFPHYYVVADMPFADYLASTFSRKARKNYKRSVRKFEDGFGEHIDWREYRDPNAIEQFLPLAKRVSAKTYQEQLLGRGFKGTPLEANIRKKAKEGDARCFLLFANDEPVAFNYAYVSNGDVLNVASGGFDPEYSKWAPGSVLDFMMLRRTFETGALRVIDFGEGEAEYKRRFSTHRTAAACVMWFKPTPKNVAIFSAHLALDRGYHGARKLLMRAGVFKQVARFARERGRSKGVTASTKPPA